jgi:hypothetical protein
MSADSAETGHGSSPAAWAAVVIMLIAFTVGTIAFWFEVEWLVWACAALVLLGLIVGFVLKRIGYGVGGDRHTPKAHN